MIAHVTEDLGLYAAGLLDENERRDVERHLDRCTECRAALAAEEATTWALAEAAARPAPGALRSRVVEAHGSRRPTRPFAHLALAAAALVVIVLGGALAQTRSDLERERALRDEYARALSALAGNGGVVALAPSAGIDGRASLVQSGGESYLVLALPAPPAGKAYEAWVIRGGDPIPAGVAPVRDGVVVLRLSTAARPGDVAAVTVEVAAGVTKPTSDPILVAKL